nr:hypothetical transcript [Hymenolepis microstoma]
MCALREVCLQPLSFRTHPPRGWETARTNRCGAYISSRIAHSNSQADEGVLISPVVRIAKGFLLWSRTVV